MNSSFGPSGMGKTEGISCITVKAANTQFDISFIPVGISIPMLGIGAQGSSQDQSEDTPQLRLLHVKAEVWRGIKI